MPQLTRHHFVLCAGFFLCRANARTQDYFRRVKEAQRADQMVMNRILLHDPNMRWQIHRPAIWHNSTGKYGKDPWHKTTVVLRHTPLWLYRVRKWLEKHDFEKLYLLVNRFTFFIYISHEIIKGSASGGLTVGVIPMHLVTRIKQEPAPSTTPLVVHTSDNKN